MKVLEVLSATLVIALMTGCVTMDGVEGARGPRLVGSGRATAQGMYGEVGLQFSTPGDLVALVNPGRWRSPLKTGGAISWLNPMAWQDDAARTGRILFGQAVVGAAAFAITADDGGGSGGSDEGGSGGTGLTPHPPTTGPGVSPGTAPPPGR